MTQSSSTAINDWLKSATDKLVKKDVSSARLDALLLLEDHLKKDRSYILSHAEELIFDPQLTALNEDLARRLKSVPMAYIRGKVEFYGRIFEVDKSVLIPRPESESFIDLVKSIEPDVSKLIDVGSGSGCIGITLKLEIPKLSVELLEKSPSALKISQKNAKLLGAKVISKENDLLANVKDCDIIVANLPYVPDSYKFDASTAHEPTEALLGGPDGLDLYRKLWQQIKFMKQRPTTVLIESLKFQHQDQEELANSCGYTLDKTDGLVQLFRYQS